MGAEVEPTEVKIAPAEGMFAKSVLGISGVTRPSPVSKL